MARLRAPDGCPWDREQTHESLLPYLMEESTEAVEAVQSKDIQHVCEELGDVLLQIVFHAQIAAESKQFDIHTVIDGIASKLVRRHPHVFSEAVADTPEAVTTQWEKIKAEEKAAKGISSSEKVPSVLDKVSRALPTLARAQKLQARAAKVGFDWPDTQGVWDKVREEIAELEVEMKAGNQKLFAEELGDLFFALVNLARHANVDADVALIGANAKFEKRFRRVEQLAGGGDAMKGQRLEQLDLFWNQAKAELG